MDTIQAAFLNLDNHKELYLKNIEMHALCLRRIIESGHAIPDKEEIHGLPQEKDIRTRNKFPLKAEFSAYLYECKYRPSSVWTYVSNMAKLNNNLFELLRSEDEHLHLLEVLSDESSDWCAIRKISDIVIEIIDSTISITKQGESPPPGIPMTVSELMRGRTAFRKYILFLKQRITHINKKRQ